MPKMTTAKAHGSTIYHKFIRGGRGEERERERDGIGVKAEEQNEVEKKKKKKKKGRVVTTRSAQSSNGEA